MQSLRISLLLSFLCFAFFQVDAEPIKFEIQGQAAILMNAETKAILFEKEAYSLQYPASITKIAVALYGLTKVGNELDKQVTAKQEALASVTPEAKRKANYKLPAHWQETDGTHIGIKKGEILSFRNLFEGMLIASGNDAANVIAQEIGPDIPSFMEDLNVFLKEIGCTQTQFLNPHGLHHPDHQTTAYDMALMASEALKNSIFCEIVAKPRFTRPKTNTQAATTLLQGNRLLRPGKYHYAKAIGIKTGYHSKAKSTFVGAAQSDGRTLIAVFFGYKDRTAMFQDAIDLFEKAFNQPKVQRCYLKEGPQSFSLSLPQASNVLHTYLKNGLTLDFYPAEDPQAKCLLYWNTLTLPIEKDQIVGELHLVGPEGKILKKTPLLASEAVLLSWPHNWIAALSSISAFALVAIIVVSLGIAWCLFRK